jgi:hypothetical protein
MVPFADDVELEHPARAFAVVRGDDEIELQQDGTDLSGGPVSMTQHANVLQTLNLAVLLLRAVLAALTPGV